MTAGGNLLEKMNELEAKEACIAHHVLPQDSSNDRRSFAGDKAGRSWRRGGNREVNRLSEPKNMLTGNAGSESAYIQGLRKFNEF